MTSENENESSNNYNQKSNLLFVAPWSHHDAVIDVKHLPFHISSEKHQRKQVQQLQTNPMHIIYSRAPAVIMFTR